MNDIHIRWIIRRDIPRVLEIERASFGMPWTEDDLIQQLRHRWIVGVLAEVETPAASGSPAIAGFCVYELGKKKLRIVNLAVAPEFRRQGIGRALVARLQQKLRRTGRDRVEVLVVDRNLDCHLFLRRLGFRATQILRDLFESRVRHDVPLAAGREGT